MLTAEKAAKNVTANFGSDKMVEMAFCMDLLSLMRSLVLTVMPNP